MSSIQARHDKWAEKVSSEEWVKRVESISGASLRTKVAAIVWWDHIGSVCDNKSTSLDKYVKQWSTITNGKAVEPKDVCEALVSIGYPQDVAMKRVDLSKRFQYRNGNKPVDLSVLRPAGADGLMYAVVTQAVEDMKYFVKHGIVVDSKVIPNWPAKGSTGAIGYSSRAEVEELINFFIDGDMEQLVTGLGTNLKMDDVLIAVGLTVGQNSPVEQVAVEAVEEVA
jgi:hypothetical protein